MKKFWSFVRNSAGENELRLEGQIASQESWWTDVVTPQAFREELDQHRGDITVWINSPGGDVFAGSAIYTALMEHKGRITVKIDGLAASAASFIAMAGDTVLMSPTATMMIHNPWTYAIGDSREMSKTAEFLDEIRDGLVMAYMKKTKKPRDDIMQLLDDETWMNAQSAVENGFADGILYVTNATSDETRAQSYSRRAVLALAQAPLEEDTEDKAQRDSIVAACANIMDGL